VPKPKDAKQQACAPSSLNLACYFAPVRQALSFQGDHVQVMQKPTLNFLLSMASNYALRSISNEQCVSWQLQESVKSVG